MPVSERPGAVVPSVQRWSTDDVPASDRLPFYADALTTGLSPRERVHVESPEPSSFHSTMEIVDVSSFLLVRQHGSAHRAYRGPDISDESPRSFSLVISVHSPWHVEHRQSTRLEAGDAILIDSRLGADMRFASAYEVSHLKLAEPWLRQWLPSPGALVGRRIAASAGWGRVLTSFAGRLSPGLAQRSPLPLSMMIDHVGALLALTSAEFEPPPRNGCSAGAIDLHARIHDVVRQRCAESALTVVDVAGALDVSARTVHRTLARFNESFGELVMAARTEIALRMLQSSLYRRMTIAEIGHRAGFTDPSHFSRTIRARCGQGPAQILRESGRRTAQIA